MGMNMKKISEQEKRLNYLLEMFINESYDYKEIKIPNHIEEKKKLLRFFMNIRAPRKLSRKFVNVQNEFLHQELLEKGVVKLVDIPTLKEKYSSKNDYLDKISVWRGDITRLEVDAIVNAANSQLLGCFVPFHGCIDNAIHSAAGMQLREECFQYMLEQRKLRGENYEEPTGSAMITKAYNLPCKYIIHTVGPVVDYQLTNELCNDLRNCYQSCLKLASKNNLRTIAFCCISTGEFHFPNYEAAKIALETVMNFLEEKKGKIDRVIFNVFKDYDLSIYEGILSDYI